MTGLLIVSDVQIFREGLAIALLRKGMYDVVQAGSRPGEALRAARRKKPRVALIDQMMDGCCTVMSGLAADAPDIALIAMGVGDNPRDILHCAEAGAAGFVPRQASLDDLVRAIEDAQGGTLRCAPEVAHALFCHVGRLTARTNGSDDNALTRREAQVLDLIERGRSNKVIARELGIEVSTVKNHVHSLLSKMGVRRRGEAAALHRRRTL
ncbi:MAG: response regulator transcription factor [Pseudomonadota bacterium]